jgi:L-alanine-DL-glutamate epimerase-like enolase superfamily enzyme
LKIEFQIQLIELPLRFEWKLSRNSSISKTNGIITAKYLNYEGLGEAAPNIRYEETPSRLINEFESISNELKNDIEEENWTKIIQGFNICSALRMGLDMAFQNLLANISSISLSEKFGLEKVNSRKIAFTIPIMDPEMIPDFIEKENLRRFSWIKIKVNKELALPIVNTVLKNYDGMVAIDGNEAWTKTNEVLDFVAKLDEDRILFLEQPLPAYFREGYEELGNKPSIEIWGDESILSNSEPEYWKKAFKGINVKLMKTGTLQNAIHLLDEAKRNGLRTMIGCMVETSIGISAALSLESKSDFMDLDGFLLLQKEPYGLVKEENGEVCLKA